MSRYIATRAIRGANALVAEAEALLDKALAEKGPDSPVAFPNTAYYLPVTYGMLNLKVTKLADLRVSLDHARKLLHPVPEEKVWVPYLGETLDSGMATLLAAEAIEGIRFVYGQQPEPYPGIELAGGTEYPGLSHSGHLNGPIDDIRLRSWGIQLVDGRMPGFAAIVGAARTNKAAVHIVRELQKRNILIFLSGNVNGRSIIDQLYEEGIEMGYDTYIVPFGRDTISAIYALGFATRSALTFGGLKPGQWREILLYNKFRVFAFVLALGEVDDLKYAAAAGAISYGFPVIADTRIPQILPTGVTRYEHVISMPWDQIEGQSEEEKAARLVQRCIEVRGVKVKITEVPIPVPYGSAFEGEVVRKADMRVEFGGRHSRAFEYLRMLPMEEVEDGKIELIGPEFDDVPVGGAMDLGILVEVAGRKMQEDFEPVLERQIHYFINGANGVQHIGQRDIAWIRISKTAAEKGFRLRHFGDILYARMHSQFGSIVDKVQVKIITDPEQHAYWLQQARAAYDRRNRRLADLTDEAVDTFYDCTLCQSFAPTHVCIVSPQRLGLCGAYNWLDCKASHEINPTGPNQPVPKGECLDPVRGIWTGVNATAVKNSRGTVQQVAMYSIMESPMTACGCFECIVMYIPEVEGVMVVSREDPSVTPMGMTFSTLAGMVGGGLQTPGVMGIGKYYLTSPKFISADGGFKRVVWMSSFLKETMAEQFHAVCQREGMPDLLDRIADERSVTSLEELVRWVKEHQHPVLQMGPMQPTAAPEAVPVGAAGAAPPAKPKEEKPPPAKVSEPARLPEQPLPTRPAEPVPAAETPPRAEPAPAAEPARLAAMEKILPPGKIPATAQERIPASAPAPEKISAPVPPKIPAPEEIPAPASAPEKIPAAAKIPAPALAEVSGSATAPLGPSALGGQEAEKILAGLAGAAAALTPAGGDGQQIPPGWENALVRVREALEAALRELARLVPPGPTGAPGGVGAVAVAPGAETPPVPPPAVERRPPPIPPWTEEKETLEILKETWPGRVRQVTLGATPAEGGTRRCKVTVGGQAAMPFLRLDGQIPHRPVLAIEILDRPPKEWSPVLWEAWGTVVQDPAQWAKAAEHAGADLVLLQLTLTDAQGQPNTAANARRVVRQVLQATGLPLIVLGPGQADADNELLVAVVEEAAGERIALGICEEKNYRTIVAAALAHGHLVTARTAMDVNLAKQLNILISDMGLPPDRILMDPTCAAVGYGMEYGYSVMERLRLAALQGDSMTQLPMIVTVGYEAWRQKECRVGQGVPEAWGDWTKRAIHWETVTAASLLQAGADIVVLRHPETLRRIRSMIAQLTEEQ